jgi:hypothetical protein
MDLPLRCICGYQAKIDRLEKGFNHLDQASRELFECLMNRIYNASDFVRLQAPSERERKAIDTWLQLQEEKELGE